MDAASLLHELRDAGLALRTEGDRLLVGPAEKLTDQWRSAIRGHKAELLHLLREVRAPGSLAERAQGPVDPQADREVGEL
jgi:hypothetical protein